MSHEGALLTGFQPVSPLATGCALNAFAPARCQLDPHEAGGNRIEEMGTEEGALLLRTAPVRQQPPPGPYANATVTRREEYRRTGAKHTRLLPKPSPHRRFRSPLHGPGGDERTY